MEEKKKKTYGREEAFQKICAYCAYQERAQQEVRDRLYDYGLHREEVEETISQLIQDGFLNEERFAQTYARGKFRMKGWGRNKIRQALKFKKVSPRCIETGMAEIEEGEYLEVLEKLAQKKAGSTKAKHPLQLKQKVAGYLISRGFEHELVYEQLDSILPST